MEFEYSHQKSEDNKQKHGISLEETKALWVVSGVEVPARTIDEVRFLRIGELQGKFYSCIYTIRDAKIRLISARRSRPEEEKIYKERIKDVKRESEKENQGE